MLIDEIVSKCDKRYSNLADCQCEDCPCETECSHDCKECLENVHFPDRTTIRREYDCVNMADCYYCKYSYRYASELIYGLRQFRDIKNRDILKVMSVGCGPCTELAALMDCFWCEIVSGELKLKEHENAKWLTKEHLDEVEWLPADVILIDKIRMDM